MTVIILLLNYIRFTCSIWRRAYRITPASLEKTPSYPKSPFLDCRLPRHLTKAEAYNDTSSAFKGADALAALDKRLNPLCEHSRLCKNECLCYTGFARVAV